MSGTSTIDEVQQAIVDDFEWMDEWTDKYKYIIDTAKELNAMPDEFKTEENKVRGCQSQVWLHAYIENGLVKFYADSDALIVKGLIALLVKVYSGRTAQEIIATEPWFIEKIGLGQHLSPTRTNGLASMIKQIKFYAIALG